MGLVGGEAEEGVGAAVGPFLVGIDAAEAARQRVGQRGRQGAGQPRLTGQVSDARAFKEDKVSNISQNKCSKEQ